MVPGDPEGGSAKHVHSTAPETQQLATNDHYHNANSISQHLLRTCLLDTAHAHTRTHTQRIISLIVIAKPWIILWIMTHLATSDQNQTQNDEKQKGNMLTHETEKSRSIWLQALLDPGT